jgi:hypothetical protein
MKYRRNVRLTAALIPPRSLPGMYVLSSGAGTLQLSFASFYLLHLPFHSLMLSAGSMINAKIRGDCTGHIIMITVQAKLRPQVNCSLGH